MYRYEVTATVKADIEGVTKKSHFYNYLGKFYINEDKKDLSINYYDSVADSFPTKTLDGICQDLYATDFASQSTEESHSIVDMVQFDGRQEVSIDKGSHSFDTIISHDWTDSSTWPATDNSVWIVQPSAPDKILLLTKSEVQFTHDVKIASQTVPGSMYFDIWVYNPLVDTGQTIDADDPSFVPGVSTGNPLRFLYKRYEYTSIKDVFNFGNEHFTMPSAVDGMSAGITTVQFNYEQHVELRGDQGSQIRFSLKDDLPLDGGFCTVSVVIREDGI